MSAIFPTLYSTLSPSALGELVTEKYDLANVQCQLLVRGVGDTYSITSAGGPAILRVYRSSHRSRPQIQAELELLLALKQANISVSYPISDTSGEIIQELDAAEGKRYAALFSFAPGGSVLKFSNKQLEQLGTEMARFHNISSTITLSDKRWNYDVESTLIRPLEIVRPAFKGNQEDYLWWQKATSKAAEKLCQADTSGFSNGYCQYDFLPNNFHFDEEKITLFDFDFLGYGWLINDITTFWTHLSLDVLFNRISQAEADAAFSTFLQAYRSWRSVSEAELAVMPYLSLGWWCYYMAFHTTHDQFYTLTQPAQLKLRTGYIRRLAERYWRTEEQHWQ